MMCRWNMHISTAFMMKQNNEGKRQHVARKPKNPFTTTKKYTLYKYDDFV